MKLELFFFPECPYCGLVLDKIQELKIESKIQMSHIRQDSKKRDFLREKTGRQTVPCLFIDEKPMFESRDIMNWLEKNIQQIHKAHDVAGKK